jgi:hypothetical protein
MAKNAAYSTDKENDQYSSYSQNAKHAGFSWKEFAVISNILSIVRPGMRTVGTGVVIGLLVTASFVRAQPSKALADPVTPAAPAKVELKMPPPLAKDDGLTMPSKLPDKLAAPTESVPIFDPMIRKISGCCSLPPVRGIGHHGYGGGGGCGAGGCADGMCNGRPPCCYTDSDSFLGRCIGGLCEEICCVDPCYEPRWVALGNAAFFQDGPRPVTTTRIRWDRGIDYNFPDSAEFFWGKIGGKGPANVPNSLRYDDLSLYQEVATPGGQASTYVTIPYRTIQSDTNPGAAGFIDMSVGFKSVLLDRELILISMQMTTYIPIGIASRGLGTGHVALEPALMAHLKLTPSTYFQTQLAYWIPLGGTGGFQGSVFHYHTALNHHICSFACVDVIGTAELNGYSFRGQFTDFGGGVVPLGGSNFLSAGPGLRFQICDQVDIGLGTAFGFGNRHGPEQLYRTELRLRF